MKINIPVSVAELLDKCSILAIKLSKCPQNSDKLENILTELTEIDSLRQDIIKSHSEKNELNLKYQRLLYVNTKIWETEDQIRLKEKNQSFDDEFIKLARDVYRLNDYRALIKKEINTMTNSYIVEEKLYESY